MEVDIVWYDKFVLCSPDLVGSDHSVNAVADVSESEPALALVW